VTPPVPPVPPGDGTPQPGAPTPEFTPAELPRWARKKVVATELSDEELEAFVGAKKWPVYRRKLAPFREDASFVPTWNWSAALVPPVWMLYRKLYLGFALFWVAAQVSGPLFLGSATPEMMKNPLAPENRSFLYLTAVVELALRIAAGGSANWLLYRRARAAKRLLAFQQVPADQTVSLLARIGGVNRGVAIFMALLSVVLGIAGVWSAQHG
jgi:hypothetical protein